MELAARPRVVLLGDVTARPQGLERELTRCGLQLAEADAPDGGTAPDAVLITLPNAEDPRMQSLLGAASEESAPPRVVVFALEDPDAPAAALAGGADDAIAAPVHLPELCARILARIRDRQQPRATPRESEMREAVRHLVNQARGVLRADEVLLALARRLVQAFDLAECSFVMLSPEESEGRVVAEIDQPAAHNPSIELSRYPEIIEAMRTRRPVIWADPRNGASRGDGGSVMVLPVQVGGAVAGVFLMRSRNPHPRLSPGQLEFARGLTDAAAKVLQTPQPDRSERVEVSGGLDALTGCADLDALDRRVREEFERARRYSLSFSVVLLDVDELRALNDRLGSEAGDRFLSELGGLLRRELRLPDFVSRYGGDEFAVLLPETGPEGARQSVLRIRDRAASLAVSGGNGAPGLSAGIVTYPHPAISRSEELLALLEGALLRAKAQVGERIGVAE